MAAPRASEDIADRTTTGLSGVTVGSYGMGAARDTLTPVTEEGQTPGMSPWTQVKTQDWS